MRKNATTKNLLLFILPAFLALSFLSLPLSADWGEEKKEKAFCYFTNQDKGQNEFYNDFGAYFELDGIIALKEPDSMKRLKKYVPELVKPNCLIGFNENYGYNLLHSAYRSKHYEAWKYLMSIPKNHPKYKLEDIGINICSGRGTLLYQAYEDEEKYFIGSLNALRAKKKSPEECDEEK